MDERASIKRLKELRADKRALKVQLSDVEKEYVRIESELAEDLMTSGRDATARYDEIGWCSLLKPKVRANVRVDDKEKLFLFLNDKGREDLLKTDVHHASLSTFVNELLELNQEVPEFINYFLEQKVRLN